MKTYIQRLNDEHKERSLIRAFQNEFPNVEVQYIYQNNFYGELVLKIHEEDNVVERVYHLTDYTCDVINDMAKLNTGSACEFSDGRVKKIYVTFMNRNFSDYREDYFKNINKQVHKDLGKTI